MVLKQTADGGKQTPGKNRRHVLKRLYQGLLGAFGWLTGRRAMASGYYNAAAFIRSAPIVSGTLWAWGRNNYGELGTGNTTNYSAPVQVGTLTTWTQVSAGYSSAGVRADGTLWVWGNNTYGQLGTNNHTNYSSPVQVGNSSSWSSICIDPFHNNTATVALQTNGTLWAWGANATGQMGTGSTTSTSSPVQVGSLTTWAQAYISAKSSFGVRSDGTLWSWGNNSYGALGINSTAAQSNPVQVGNLSTWVKLATVSQTTFGLQSTGSIWAWGYNAHGDLGHGTNINSYSSPVQTLGATPWYVAGFGKGIANNGTLWAWGYNGVGRVGNGKTVMVSSPVQIGSLSTWAKLSTFNGAFGIQTTGSLWAWGGNTYGNLGTNNTTAYSSPVQVGSVTTWQQISTGEYVTLGIQVT